MAAGAVGPLPSPGGLPGAPASLTFAESDGGLNWKEAISLIMMSVLFVVVESTIKTLQ